MTAAHWNVALGIALLVVFGFVLAAQPDATQPNYEFLPEMKRSPAAHAFDASPVFRNGRTAQPPVPGAIARGERRLYFAPTKEDAARAGEELKNPYLERLLAAASEPPRDLPVDDKQADDRPANKQAAGDKPAPDKPKPAVSPAKPPARPDPRGELAASVARGAETYRTLCAACHGPNGAGDGPVAQRGFPPPPPLPTGKSAQMKDGQLFHILTYGQGSMASMANQLAAERRWDAINFVRTLQTKAAGQDAGSKPAPDGAKAAPPVPKTETPKPNAPEAKP